MKNDDKENTCSMNVVSPTSTISDEDFVAPADNCKPNVPNAELPATPLGNLSRRSVCDPGFATPSFPPQFKKKRFYKN